MPDKSRSPIGILPCPGGMVFAQKIFQYLETISREKFESRVDLLSKTYGIDRSEIVRRINLMEDLQPGRLESDEPVDAYRTQTTLIPARHTRFPNGELKTEILSSIRNMDIYVVQDVANSSPLTFPQSDGPQVLTVNDHFFSLIVTVDAALQAGAEKVTVVLPTFPYARQHKKKGRESLSAARIGQMLENLGVERVITLDIHSKEIENSFNHMRLENLHGAYQIMKVLSGVIDLKDESLMVVSPDTGGVDRNKFFASTLGKPLGILYKERDYSRIARDAENGNITNMKLLGSVAGKTVFMHDDMLGTGGTLIKAMRVLRENGAEKVIAAASLPLFTGRAMELLEKAYCEGLFYRVICTNAVYQGQELLSKEWYLSADVSSLFGRIIYRLHHRASLSSLLDDRSVIKDLLKRS